MLIVRQFISELFFIYEAAWYYIAVVKSIVLRDVRKYPIPWCWFSDQSLHNSL